MDLRERSSNTIRHPWEVSRLEAVRRLIRLHCPQGSARRILDVGCGDGYVIESLAAGRPSDLVHAFDPFLEEQDVSGRDTAAVKYYKVFSDLRNDYDLVLMLDVLEHIEDDRRFLADIVRHRTSPDALFLITVPAFRCLYSSHDTFLRHFRRYDRTDLDRLISSCGLCPVCSGGLFASLLIPRSISLIGERFRPPSPKARPAISSWRHPAPVTAVVTAFLNADNALQMALNRLRIPTAGLTLWTIARKMP